MPLAITPTLEVAFPSMFYKTADPNVVIWKSANSKFYACRVHDRSFIGELLSGTHYAVGCTVP